MDLKLNIIHFIHQHLTDKYQLDFLVNKYDFMDEHILDHDVFYKHIVQHIDINFNNLQLQFIHKHEELYHQHILQHHNNFYILNFVDLHNKLFYYYFDIEHHILVHHYIFHFDLNYEFLNHHYKLNNDYFLHHHVNFGFHHFDDQLHDVFVHTDFYYYN
mmetsp:Transcript_544/g.1200  ORF Transcript_544/g.1200 Transcript_544/m.1200 type:complete len:159 (+) Transcript_544:592-1068(+)